MKEKQYSNSPTFFKNSLCDNEIDIICSHTFGAFYLPFLAETKKRFIEKMGQLYRPETVSYTHLDVYKRQEMFCARSDFSLTRRFFILIWKKDFITISVFWT